MSSYDLSDRTSKQSADFVNVNLDYEIQPQKTQYVMVPKSVFWIAVAVCTVTVIGLVAGVGALSVKNNKLKLELVMKNNGETTTPAMPITSTQTPTMSSRASHPTTTAIITTSVMPPSSTTTSSVTTETSPSTSSASHTTNAPPTSTATDNPPTTTTLLTDTYPTTTTTEPPSTTVVMTTTTAMPTTAKPTAA